MWGVGMLQGGILTIRTARGGGMLQGGIWTIRTARCVWGGGGGMLQGGIWTIRTARCVCVGGGGGMLQGGIWTLGIARIQQWKLWPRPWAACSSQPSSSSFDTVHPHLFEDTGSIIRGTGEVEVPVCIVSLAQQGMEWLLMPRHPDSYIRVNWQQCTGYIKNKNKN